MLLSFRSIYAQSNSGRKPPHSRCVDDDICDLDHVLLFMRAAGSTRPLGPGYAKPLQPRFQRRYKRLRCGLAPAATHCEGKVAPTTRRPAVYRAACR